MSLRTVEESRQRHAGDIFLSLLFSRGDLTGDVNGLLLILIPESGINHVCVYACMYVCFPAPPNNGSLQTETRSHVHTHAPPSHKGSYEMTGLN